jgi:O-antigen/teichoic acid export membrane protein
MCLAQPAVSTLFGSSFSSTPLFLALLAVAYVFPAFGSLTTGNFIISQGKTTFSLYLTILTVAIGLPIGYLLIMHFGVLGLIITSLTTTIPSLIISLVWIKKHYALTVDWRSSAKILTSSLSAAVLTYTLVAILPFFSWIRLIIGVGFFIIIFVVATLLTRTLNKTDLDNLRGLASGLGPLSGFLKRVLDFMEKIITALKL